MPPPAAAGSDQALVDDLRGGDEAAFATVVDQWSPAMLRLARCYVRSDASAEDVVQEAWLAALRGLDRFEGRSRLRTWVLHIVANIARTAGEKEHRSTPFPPEALTGGPTVPAGRFHGPGEPAPGSWRTGPAPWQNLPEGALLSSEAYGVLRQAVAELPDAQRTVIAMRDLDGLDAEEVCQVLGLSAGNQRVLLHRARASVRAKVEPYFAGRAATGVSGGLP